MCTSHDHDLGEAPQAGAGRRGFLRATALLGATAAAVTALPAVTAEAAASTWRPDPHSRRFTLAVMPDTQYLFDGPSIDKALPTSGARKNIQARQTTWKVSSTRTSAGARHRVVDASGDGRGAAGGLWRPCGGDVLQPACGSDGGQGGPRHPRGPDQLRL